MYLKISPQHMSIIAELKAYSPKNFIVKLFLCFYYINKINNLL